jgi:hypothetical protein
MGAVPGYTNPATALGPPERMTGDGFAPQVVTPFQPAFLASELVSIGMGGQLVLAFDHDVVDDPRNPFGIDLLVFSNAFYTDVGGGSGVVGSLFGEGGAVAVSADGLAWTTVPLVVADGAFPTLGFSDVLPFQTTPGRVQTDFTKPVDPGLRGAALAGLDWPSLVAAYDGAGGGAGIDLASVGLAAIRFVRISGGASFGVSPEVDAIADVAPRPTEGPLGDLDRNGVVDAADLAILLGAWSLSGPADLDGSGLVDAADLAILLGGWTS